MERIPCIDCGDGYRRADAGCLRIPLSKTASFSIVQGDAGSVYNNTGAAGTITATLPTSPKDGTRFWFFVTAAFTLTIKAGTGATINGSASAGTYSNAGTNGVANAEVIAMGGNWFVKSIGTWSTS